MGLAGCVGAAALLPGLVACEAGAQAGRGGNTSLGGTSPGGGAGPSPKAQQFANELAAGNPDYFLFTDSLGREVALPRRVQRISPSGPYAQIMLTTLCKDKLISLSSSFGKKQERYLGASLTNLPVFGRFYGKNADLNYEEIIRASPDVIVDIGEVSSNIGQDMDGLQAQTGLPVVSIEATMPHLATAYEMVGEVVAEPQRAATLAAYAHETLELAARNQAELAARSIRVLYSSGVKGLSVKERGSVHSSVIDALGLDNVAVLSQVNSTEVNIEQVLEWQPSVVLLSPAEGFFDDVFLDPVWALTPAVKEGRVYEVPGEPWEWLDMPPSVQTLLGLRWLGSLLAPDLYNFDIVAEAQRFYKLFWGYDLDAEEARALMANSSFLRN